MDEPQNAEMVRTTLSSMDVEQYDECVVQQLLELVYRHVDKASSAAIKIARHSSRTQADEEDVKLAIRMTRPPLLPTHTTVQEIANDANKQPLPQVVSKPGVSLPTKWGLSTRNYDVIISRNRAPGPWPEIFAPIEYRPRRKPTVQRPVKSTSSPRTTTDIHAPMSITPEKQVFTTSRAQAISILRSPFTAPSTDLPLNRGPTLRPRPSFTPFPLISANTLGNMPEPPTLRAAIAERPDPDTRYRAAIPTSHFELDPALLRNVPNRITIPKPSVETGRQQNTKNATRGRQQINKPVTSGRAQAPSSSSKPRVRPTLTVPQLATRLRPNIEPPSTPRLLIRKKPVPIEPLIQPKFVDNPRIQPAMPQRPLIRKRPTPIEPLIQPKFVDKPRIHTAPEEAIGKVPKVMVKMPKRPGQQPAQSSGSDDFSDIVNNMSRPGPAITPTRKSTAVKKLSKARKLEPSSSEEETTEQEQDEFYFSNETKKQKISLQTNEAKFFRPPVASRIRHLPSISKAPESSLNDESKAKLETRLELLQRDLRQRQLENKRSEAITRRRSLKNTIFCKGPVRRRYSDEDFERIPQSKGISKRGANERRSTIKKEDSHLDVRAKLNKLMKEKNIKPQKIEAPAKTPPRNLRDSTPNMRSSDMNRTNKKKKEAIEIIEID